MPETQIGVKDKSNADKDVWCNPDPAVYGAVADAAYTTGSGGIIAILKGIFTKVAGTLTVGLPSGAATAAKQPVIGTAGSPSTDVLSMQGVASGTPLSVAGGTANVTLSPANPIPVALYITGGTSGLASASTNSDTMSFVSSATALSVNAVLRINNGTNGSRVAQIDVATSAATGVLAMAVAGSPRNNITTATTTIVKSGAGILQSIVFNTPTACTVTIYDNTTATGTKIGTLTIAVGQPFTLPYNTYFSTGLTIVTSATIDITVNYR